MIYFRAQNDLGNWASEPNIQLEQLERLRSEDTLRRLMITHTIESYWIPSQWVREIHRWPLDFRHWGSVMWSAFPHHDVTMTKWGSNSSQTDGEVARHFDSLLKEPRLWPGAPFTNIV